MKFQKTIDITFAQAITMCIIFVLIKAELESPMQKSLKPQIACSQYFRFVLMYFINFFNFNFILRFQSEEMFQ